MSWAFLRREWGAVTFVLTVVVGMIVVPLALYFTNLGPNAVKVPNIAVTASPIACASPSPSGTPSKTPSPSPAKSPTPSPAKSPTASPANSPTPAPSPCV